ncbi:MAG: DUF445 domain-containing protein [Alphaproteobacteria bacterium]
MTAAATAPGGEDVRWRDLRRFRRVATGLLVVMALVFLATRLVPEPGFWTLLLRAGAEAALVGGLADWFAVTALFRHPFGIPIPHTALIPRNKDRIGEGLGSFVERHFLDPMEVARKLHEVDAASRFGAWLARERNADSVARRVTAAVPFVVRSLEDREIRDFLHRAVNQQVHSLDLAPFLGRAVAALTGGEYRQAMIDRAVALATGVLAEHEERIYAMVEERSVWWLPPAVDRHVARAIIGSVQEVLGNLADPRHESRRQLDHAIDTLINDLRRSETFRQHLATVKTRLLESPATREYLAAVWTELRHGLVADAQAPDSRLRRGISGGLRGMGEALLADQTMRERLNGRIQEFVLTAIVPWRGEIGRFIAGVVRRWDGRTISERIELEVGRDLQYIRINGTVVGALVGCALYLVSIATN